MERQQEAGFDLHPNLAGSGAFVEAEKHVPAD